MVQTILVVDDSPPIVGIVVSMLKTRGYRTIAAYSGEECLKVLQEERPDVVLLDVMMHPIDGWDTLKRIRSDDRTRHIPVLMLTGKELTPGEQSTYGRYFEDLIMKPMTHRDLYRALDHVFGKE